MPHTTRFRSNNANSVTNSRKKVDKQASSTKKSLLSLPNELLFKIISIIDLEDIRALTCLAMASKPSLLLVEAATGRTLEESQHISRRLGNPRFALDNISAQLRRCDNLPERYAKLATQKILQPPNLSYLKLNGSLSWLTPLSPEADAEEEGHRMGPMVRPKGLRPLLAQAQRLHLTIPPALLTLMRSEDLQRRFAFGGNRFSAGKYLTKCPADTDRNAGGYALQVYEDQQGCWYVSVYIDGMGQSCVLFSGGSPNEMDWIGTEEMSEDGMREFMGDASAVALDFEEFLYHTWMEECQDWTVGEEGWSQAQRMYLERVEGEGSEGRVN